MVEILNMSLKIDNPTELINELWDKLQSSGLYAYSKNDIYDYLIYLLNKYDENRFFDTNSNALNSRLLKVSQTRIKTAKTNISVKFMSENEYDEIFINFLNDCKNNLIKFKESIKKGKIKFVLENPATRLVLETKLKNAISDTLDYHLNKEIVEIEANNFLSMLLKELEILENNKNLNQKDKKLLEKLQEVKKIIKKEKNKKELKENIEAGINISTKFTTQIVTSAISAFFGF